MVMLVARSMARQGLDVQNLENAGVGETPGSFGLQLPPQDRKACASKKKAAWETIIPVYFSAA